MNYRLGLSLASLASLMALSACKAEDPPPEKFPLRYAYVVKAPGAECGTIKILEAEDGADEPEISDWQESRDECQTRPSYGPDGELVWWTFDEEEGNFGEWALEMKRVGEGVQIIRQYQSAERGRLTWSPTGDHIGFYYQQAGADVKLTYYDTATALNADELELNPVAVSDDDELREPTWPPDGSQLSYPSYQSTDNDIPRFNMDLLEVATGTELGHFSFDTYANYDRIRQLAYTSKFDRLFVHAEDATYVGHVLAVTLGESHASTLLYSAGDMMNHFGPLQVSPDGSKVAFTDQGKLIMATAEAVVTTLLTYPGDPMNNMMRRLQWADNERLTYTVEMNPKRIDVYDLTTGEASILVAEDGMDVYELSWDPNAPGRAEGAVGTTGSEETGGEETGGTSETGSP